MNCLEFSKQVKLECVPVRTRTGEDALFVALSASFIDGAPLPMYVIGAGSKVNLTDGGDTIFHLHNIGFRILGDKRRWASLRNAVEAFGAKLNDSGEIEIWADESDLADGVARFTASLLAAAAWEIDHFGQPLDGTALIEEVKEYLMILRPNADLKENVPIKGISGRVYEFPLSFSGVLVDAMAQSGASSNSMVRRLVDIRAVPSQQNTIIEIAVDDRNATKKSEEDIRLLELLATPLRVSVLTKAREAITILH